MKKLIALLALLTVSAQAATTVQSVIGTNTVVFSTPLVLESVTVMQNATNGLVRLYDNSTTNVVWTNDTVVSVRSYLTNVADNYVTSSGVTNFITNTVRWYYSVTNAATNTLAPIVTLPAMTNNPFSMTINRVLARGLVVSNDGSGNVIINYRTP